MDGFGRATRVCLQPTVDTHEHMLADTVYLNNQKAIHYYLFGTLLAQRGKGKGLANPMCLARPYCNHLKSV